MCFKGCFDSTREREKEREREREREKGALVGGSKEERVSV